MLPPLVGSCVTVRFVFGKSTAVFCSVLFCCISKPERRSCGLFDLACCIRFSSVGLVDCALSLPNKPKEANKIIDGN